LDNFDEQKISNVTIGSKLQSQLNYNFKIIKEQNWNEVWESNYDPVIIKNLVYIRAPFHITNRNIKYEIIVDPKMSFGTAHHETTSLMIEMMLDEEIHAKNVLDMGCGTGILAILAEMMGAKKIDAVDNDKWAYQNSMENIDKNKCKSIRVELGDAGVIKPVEYDYILANINRNVLLQDIPVYATHLENNGVLLLSGFYTEDLRLIESLARDNNFKLDNKLSKNNWVAARFMKI
ncbi:MAG: 50S ribosomal protein L11 methyltransferase, partial [Bacteroidales bacterium]|nr:50S ribosomal protein L11 methyltransferase [Bacteroidales bacterium]